MKYVIYGAGIWAAMGVTAMVVDGLRGNGWSFGLAISGPLGLYSVGKDLIITKPAAPQLPAGAPTLKAV